MVAEEGVFGCQSQEIDKRKINKCLIFIIENIFKLVITS